MQVYFHHGYVLRFLHLQKHKKKRKEMHVSMLKYHINCEVLNQGTSSTPICNKFSTKQDLVTSRKVFLFVGEEDQRDSSRAKIQQKHQSVTAYV